MKPAVYIPYNNDLHREVLAAFCDGCGGELRAVEVVEPLADMAVVFGVGKKSVPYSEHRGVVIDTYKDAGKPVIVLERGYVKRDIYHSAGWNWFNGGADFKNENCPPDRWDKLGVDLSPDTLGHGDYLLLIGQVPWDASVQHTDHVSWLSLTANALKAFGYPIVFRQHPKGPDIDMLGVTKSNGTLEEDLDKAAAVFTFNSNVGVDAVIRGIPTFSFDKGSMVYDVSFHKFSDINLIDSRTFDRQTWANNIAYTQWTVEEMREGMAWEHLLGFT